MMPTRKKGGMLMTENRWVHESRKTVVCIDRYENGNPEGRLYNAYAEPETFQSLTQFLIKMEALLDDLQLPQSSTTTRTFSQLTLPFSPCPPVQHVRKGSCATFEVQILFRQHSSWQGNLIWLEQQMEQSFRSVLELILLMDNALRKLEGYDCA